MIYLDINHWIGLAKAHTGHPDGACNVDALNACVRAVQTGTARFPISDSTFLEVSQIGRFRQRRDLRDVIELVSQYFVVTSRSVIATHEIEAALDVLVGPSRDPINPMRYLDWGVARAFGMAGGFKVVDQFGNDVTEQARQDFAGGPAAFDQLCRFGELELVRNVLAGPSPEDGPAMRALGWRPSDVEISRRRAAQEVEQVARFDIDPSWRRGRIRDIVAAREILIEHHGILQRGLSDRGAEHSEVFPRPEVARSVFDAMPSFDVAVSLKTSYHSNPHHRWTPNDIHDIDTLGSTIPYCDIVVTEASTSTTEAPIWRLPRCRVRRCSVARVLLGSQSSTGRGTAAMCWSSRPVQDRHRAQHRGTRCGPSRHRPLFPMRRHRFRRCIRGCHERRPRIRKDHSRSGHSRIGASEWSQQPPEFELLVQRPERQFWGRPLSPERSEQLRVRYSLITFRISSSVGIRCN